MKRVYLDNAASTPVNKKYLKSVLKQLKKDKLSFCGNPSSSHSLGEFCKNKFNSNCSSIKYRFILHRSLRQECIITSSGTEANNIAILGLEKYLKSVGKTHIVTSEVEHSSVLNPIKELSTRGFHVTYVKPDSNGVIRSDDVIKAMIGETGLVSVMAVNNEIGVRNEIREVGKFCNSNGIIFHSDFVQGYYLPPEASLNVDLLTMSGHKFGTPKGVGALIISDAILKYLEPLTYGGGQQCGIKPGTEDVVGAYLLSKAIDKQQIDESKFNSITNAFFFVDTLKYYLSEYYMINTFRVNGIIQHPSQRIINLTIDKVNADLLTKILSNKGIYISTSSACNNNNSSRSHVLKAMELSDKIIDSSIRISFYNNSKRELKYAAKIIAECIYNIRLLGGGECN